MRFSVQRTREEAPYAAAYFRIQGQGAEPSRGSVVLSPGAGPAELARMLGLVLALGEGSGGSAPIRQLWLQADGRIQGKMGSDLSARHADEAERLTERVRGEWAVFVDKALARLRGEEVGGAHFRFPEPSWDPEQPAVLVTRWPPLEGESLPVLE